MNPTLMTPSDLNYLPKPPSDWELGLPHLNLRRTRRLILNTPQILYGHTYTAGTICGLSAAQGGRSILCFTCCFPVQHVKKANQEPEDLDERPPRVWPPKELMTPILPVKWGS